MAISRFRRGGAPIQKIPTSQCSRCKQHGYVCARCKRAPPDCECEGRFDGSDGTEWESEPCWYCEVKP